MVDFLSLIHLARFFIIWKRAEGERNHQGIVLAEEREGSCFLFLIETLRFLVLFCFEVASVSTAEFLLVITIKPRHQRTPLPRHENKNPGAFSWQNYFIRSI